MVNWHIEDLGVAAFFLLCHPLCKRALLVHNGGLVRFVSVNTVHGRSKMLKPGGEQSFFTLKRKDYT